MAPFAVVDAMPVAAEPPAVREDLFTAACEAAEAFRGGIESAILDTVGLDAARTFRLQHEQAREAACTRRDIRIFREPRHERG